MNRNLKKDDKEMIKEALKEWLDEKFIALGRWSLGAIMALILASIIYFILWANGWKNEAVPGPDTELRDKSILDKKIGA